MSPAVLEVADPLDDPLSDVDLDLLASALAAGLAAVWLARRGEPEAAHEREEQVA